MDLAAAIPPFSPFVLGVLASVVAGFGATTLGAAAKILSDHKFGALPVVDRGKLVGIITTSDLLRALQEMAGE